MTIAEKQEIDRLIYEKAVLVVFKKGGGALFFASMKDAYTARESYAEHHRNYLMPGKPVVKESAKGHGSLFELPVTQLFVDSNRDGSLLPYEYVSRRINPDEKVDTAAEMIVAKRKRAKAAVENPKKPLDDNQKQAAELAAGASVLVWRSSEQASLFFPDAELANTVQAWLARSHGLDQPPLIAHREAPALYEVRVTAQEAEAVTHSPEYSPDHQALGGGYAAPGMADAVARKLFQKIGEVGGGPEAAETAGPSDEALARNLKEKWGITKPAPIDTKREAPRSVGQRRR